MELLQSISPIEKKFETAGSRPFLILASDLEHYICKYPKYQPDIRLGKEFLGQRFAQVWNIPVPKMVEIQISSEHLPDEMLGDGLSHHSIENTIIGFQQIPDVIEIMDKQSEGYTSGELSKFDKELFFKIALFDIWLGNDDRNSGNTNLLINQSGNVISPIAIDHETIFNTGSLDRPIYELSYEDSLFYSILYHRMMTNSQKTLDIIESVCSSLQDNAQACADNLDQYFNEIPGHWIPKADVFRQNLENNIFAAEWLNKVERTFREFVSLARG